jgi:hypothetical protein
VLSYLSFLPLVFSEHIEVLQLHLLVLVAQIARILLCLLVLAQSLDQYLIVKLHFLQLFILGHFTRGLTRLLLQLSNTALTFTQLVLQFLYLLLHLLCLQ